MSDNTERRLERIAAILYEPDEDGNWTPRPPRPTQEIVTELGVELEQWRVKRFGSKPEPTNPGGLSFPRRARIIGMALYEDMREQSPRLVTRAILEDWMDRLAKLLSYAEVSDE